MRSEKAMETRRTEHIRLWGIVQGVGFRPFVAKTAERLQMKGSVLNIGGLVEITVTDTPDRIDSFLDAIREEKPAPAEIVHIKRTELPLTEFGDFQILHSGEGNDEAAMIPPDMAVCPDCLKELYDPGDPRYLHPFISCMICGPRYTIIDRIPYDRCNTSMVDFPMCGLCEGQYNDLHERRHHAQTISCHSCGPYLKWREQGDDPKAGHSLPLSPADLLRRPDADAARASDARILDRAAQILKDGGVIAFKCVGGYNLVANPFHEDAVRTLRAIKGRESKPFAVMFRSTEQIRRFCRVNEVEQKLLESSARPIILLEHRLAEDAVLPDGASADDLMRSRFIGSFLPSLAAQYLLLDRTGPLIFTSANRSDLPMIRDDAEMLQWFEKEPGIRGIISNDRKIRIRMDDSVTRVIDDQPQMIRRSKGYAPLPLYLDAGRAGAESSLSVFAAGSQLKNSFVLSKGPFLYMSQYFGDMDTVENQKIYEENVRRMADLLRIRPQAVVCDMHPLYETGRFARAYAQENDLPLLEVQHHHAHVCSVMAENDLRGQVIGVSFDGTGYGTDGSIWGGEFLLCEGSSFRRLSHLEYIDMIGGDSSMKDARRSALSYMAAAANRTEGSAAPDDDGCRQIRIDLSDIFEYGSERVLGCPEAGLILRAIRAGVNTIRSSSMGRLFDAVSCLLGIQDHNDYEGQCAIMLEDAAAFAVKHPGERKNCDLALAFHEQIIDMIVRECRIAREKTGADQVALTGGTFQNKILMEGALSRLRGEGFRPFYNISVSPNDGGIAMGQAYAARFAFGTV